MGHDTDLTSEFRLGPWLVQPTQNRLGDGERTVQVEPKMMDVLVLLASRGGAVVSKREIDDEVWSDVIVSEAVITRAIAGLRRALGDDAARPSFIETIPKRGYRLIPTIEPAAAAGAPAAAVVPPRSAPNGMGPPFAAGRWVRGPGFVGREALLAEILDGPRHCVWVLGTRAVGKTSLLKQLEHLTADGRPELAVYWDLQGATTPDDLATSLEEALLDAGELLAAAGVAVDAVRGDDAPATISALRRALRTAGRRLLLLADEVEELVAIGRNHPPLLRRLRRALQAHDDLRAVLVSSSRLWALAAPAGDTSPFLHGFTPPCFLGAFTANEATSLIARAVPHLPATADLDAAAGRIRELTGDHPALLQLACSRWLGGGDLDEALAAVAADRSVQALLEVDHALRATAEQQLLAALATGPLTMAQLADDSDMAAALYALEQLGVVRRDPDDRVTIAGTLLRDWLRAHPANGRE